jgi:hypothetical protein
MSYRAKVEAKYSLRERLETRNKPTKLSKDNNLVAWMVPRPFFHSTQKKVEDFLKTRGVKFKPLLSKDPHVSVALVNRISPEQIEEIEAVGAKLAPTFDIIGVSILQGRNTPYDYIALDLTAPEGLKKFYSHLLTKLGRQNVLDYRTFWKDHHPHISVAMIEKKDYAQVKDMLGELRKVVGKATFKPDFAWTSQNFEMISFQPV